MNRNLEAILIVLLLVSSIALSVAAYIFGVFRFDLEIAFRMFGNDNPVVIAIMTVVSFLGDGWMPVILVLLAAGVCAVLKKWLEAVFVVATLSSGILAGVLKALVGRPRPPGFLLAPSDIFQSFNQYAYPSGHVLFFVVFFGFLSFLAWMHVTGRMRGIIIAGCSCLIVLIGPSRIYLGEHWASDVIGSYLIGTFWLIILILLYLMIRHRIESAGQPPR
ncbi:MAG: phosphatase PAP2 family protein [Methanomicrobiales archaeon]|nr:phosphatase PAP2 family protein [Methanomicrobiales archaeon]NYT21443.1 phosphatase PAP2 family protein [Methanomicrobiales archaeon]